LKAAHRSIERGLKQAISHAAGNKIGAVVYHPRPINVQALRQKLGMTQREFAAQFGFSAATLRHWERGDRIPHGPARVLLTVIEHNPSAVMAALAA
jgi:putative transcriptional regulator